MRKAACIILILIAIGLIAGFYMTSHTNQSQQAVPGKVENITETNEAIKPEETGATNNQIPVPGTNISSITLQTKTWEWVSAQFEDGRVVTPKRKEFTLKFSPNGQFTATTDCNQVGGNYTADSKTGTLSFSQIFSTKMFCQGTQETEFVTLLQNTSSYHFGLNGELIWGLKFDSGTALFK